MKNIKALREAGYDVDKIMEEERAKAFEAKEVSKSNESIEKKGNKEVKLIEAPPYPIPYIYSAEPFIDDCRSLIEKISSKYSSESPPLEVIMIVQRYDYRTGKPYVTLHKIYSDSSEQEIEDFTFSGSGSPYVDMFFDSYTPKSLTEEGEHLKKTRTLAEIIQLATLTIKFVEEKIKGSAVGVGKNKMPQIVIYLDNGRRGTFITDKQKELLEIVEKKLSNFDAWSDNNEEYTKFDDINWFEFPVNIS